MGVMQDVALAPRNAFHGVIAVWGVALVTALVLGFALPADIRTGWLLIAFGGVFPTGVLQDMVVTNWVLKTAYETVMTPVTYLVVNKLKAAEGIDVYDRDTDFSPIAVGG